MLLARLAVDHHPPRSGEDRDGIGQAHLHILRLAVPSGVPARLSYGLRLAACGPLLFPPAASREPQAGVELPRRLDHSGHLALQGAVAEADAAHLELVQEG